MELKDLLKLYLKNWLLVFIVGFLGVVFAFVYNQSRNEVYEAAFLLYLKPQTISKPEIKNATDEYYSQLKVRDFSDSLITYLVQPEIQKEIGVGFQLKKLTPQILKLITSEQNPKSARNTAVEAVNKIKTKVEVINSDGTSFFSIEKLSEEPSLKKVDPHKNLNLVVGLLTGFLIGILVVSAKSYLYPKQV